MAAIARQQHEPIQNSLAAITSRMRATILRSLASRALIDRRHVACAIATANAQILQIDNPARLAITDAVLRSVLAAFDGNLADGDIVLTNDPFSGGTHLQDVTLITPIFLKGELVGYGIVQVPLADIGGNALGGYDPRALEIWAEGVRVTPVKFYRSGNVQRDALTMLLLNSRLPHLIEKDVEIIVGALTMSKSEIAALITRYSTAEYTQAAHELLAETEAQTKKTLQELPSGSWRGVSESIHSCLEEREFLVAVEMSIANGAVSFDFSESSTAAKGFINTTESATKAATLVPFYNLWPTLAVNNGLLQPFSFIIPEGSLLHAKVPASVGWSLYHPSLVVAQAVTQCLQHVQKTHISEKAMTDIFSPPPLPFSVTGCGRPGCPFPSLPRA